MRRALAAVTAFAIMVLVVLGSVGNVHSTGLAVDGGVANECGPAGSCSVTLTTGSPNEVIIVFASNGVSDAFGPLTDAQSKLTFTQRATKTNGLEVLATEWWALASTTLSGDTITLNAATANGHAVFSLVVWSITGANTAAPFDPNGALPAENSGNTLVSPNVVVSTSNPNDMILGLAGAAGVPATWTSGGGFALIDSPGHKSGAAEFEVVSSTQSSLNLAINPNARVTWVMVGDAVQAATTPPPPIPEYPLGLLVLAVFMVFSYTLIRRKNAANRPQP